MRFIALLILPIFGMFANVEDLIAVASRPPRTFLRNASEKTKKEYLALEENRDMARAQLQHAKDQLIEGESDQVKELYTKHKKFEADRKKQIDEAHLMFLEEMPNLKFREYTDKAHQIYNDETLSANQACDKLILLKAKANIQLMDGVLNQFDCGPFH